jgi:hypothetical protein
MSNPDKCKQMAIEVTKQLAEESKRDAKGVDWDVYQKECDRNEGLEYEIEGLIIERDEAISKCAVMDSVLLDTCTADTKVLACEAATDAYDLTNKEALNKIKADAIREAAKSLCWYRGLPNTVDASELNEYADKLEKGEL